MSIPLSDIPASASLAETIEGTIHAPGEKNHGKPAKVQVWNGTFGSERRPAIWIAMWFPGANEMNWRNLPYMCTRATGRNIPVWRKAVADMRTMIVPAKREVAS